MFTHLSMDAPPSNFAGDGIDPLMSFPMVSAAVMLSRIFHLYGTQLPAKGKMGIDGMTKPRAVHSRMRSKQSAHKLH